MTPPYKYPCVRCNKFICALGEARCHWCQADVDLAAELKRYGHSARKCPKRIDVSTYAETAYVHGECKVPEVDFKFTSGDSEYHVKGDMQSIDKSPNYAYSPSGTQKVTVVLWGSVEKRTLHAAPHFTSNSGDARHKICLCQCAECDPGNKCGCKDCSCGSLK